MQLSGRAYVKDPSSVPKTAKRNIKKKVLSNRKEEGQGEDKGE